MSNITMEIRFPRTYTAMQWQEAYQTATENYPLCFEIDKHAELIESGEVAKPDENYCYVSFSVSEHLVEACAFVGKALGGKVIYWESDLMLAPGVEYVIKNRNQFNPGYRHKSKDDCAPGCMECIMVDIRSYGDNKQTCVCNNPKWYRQSVGKKGTCVEFVPKVIYVRDEE